MSRPRERRARRAPPARPHSVPVASEPPPPPVAPSAWRAPVALVVLAWALLFFPQLFLGQRFVLGDASAFRPFPEFSRARWHETRARTYWNPYVFMGIEAVASLGDSRPQYLPDLGLAATERLHEPAFAPQLWLLLAHLAGTLALMALAWRLWGADPWSAATGAMAWLLAAPLLVPFSNGFDAHFLTSAIAPVMLLGTRVVIASMSPHATIASTRRSLP